MHSQAPSESSGDIGSIRSIKLKVVELEHGELIGHGVVSDEVGVADELSLSSSHFVIYLLLLLDR